MKPILLTLALFTISMVLYAQDTYQLDEQYEINLNGTLSLDTDDADVSIIGTNRSDVHLKVYRKIKTKGIVWGEKDFYVEVDSKNGNLSIKDVESGSITVMGYFEEEYKIDIEVPLGISLDIDGDDDDYIIKNIAGAIALDIDDGDVELTQCTGNSFDFDLDDGDIVMDRGAGSLNVKADDGDVRISNASFTSINARLDDGDLSIQTSLTDGGEYEFNGDDSDINLDIIAGGGVFKINHDDSRVRTMGNFQQVENDEDYTELKLANGTASVRVRVDDASIRIAAQ